MNFEKYSNRIIQIGYFAVFVSDTFAFGYIIMCYKIIIVCIIMYYI